MAKSHFKNLQEAIRISLLLVSTLFVVEAADLLLRQQTHLTLAGYGIVPRTVPGLVGLVCRPLLPASPAHLLANALPLFILLVLLFWDRHYYPGLTVCSIWFFSGLGTWLIGRSGTVHIGASSIIFGLAHLPDLRYVVLATLAGVAYGWVYLATRRITASAVTHALVDWIWLLLFRV